MPFSYADAEARLPNSELDRRNVGMVKPTFGSLLEQPQTSGSSQLGDSDDFLPENATSSDEMTDGISSEGMTDTTPGQAAYPVKLIDEVNPAAVGEVYCDPGTEHQFREILVVPRNGCRNHSEKF